MAYDSNANKIHNALAFRVIDVNITKSTRVMGD